MPYLMRMKARPDDSQLNNRESRQIAQWFNVFAGEVLIHGEPVGWEEIDAVELVQAPTVGNLSSVLLGAIINTSDRYHVGIYLGRDEAVVPNVTKTQALYILQAVAYYAPNLVQYKGPTDVVPLNEI